MLGEKRQPGARQPVGDPRMDRAQPLDRGEQAERAAPRRLDQLRVSPGQRGDIVSPDVGDNQHLGLARDGLPLLAQHVDPIDTGTLVDIFRDDPRASLLGTDALRDGVDVPGESLRLVVMERVPWPRPTVLHAARRLAGGGSAYDDRIVRARLAQGFGRLIRRQGDRGLFVILSSAMPSRLLTAFPPEVMVSRVPLDLAIARVARRLGSGRQADSGGQTDSGEEGGGEPVAQVDEAGDIGRG